tara:strand:+ start:13888 stop:14220 length:333 start_codon:yes stop_codon:yes gene_type:complete
MTGEPARNIRKCYICAPQNLSKAAAAHLTPALLGHHLPNPGRAISLAAAGGHSCRPVRCIARLGEARNTCEETGYFRQGLVPAHGIMQRLRGKSACPAGPNFLNHHRLRA